MGSKVAAVLPLVVGDAGTSETDALRGKLVELQQDLNVRFVERFAVVEGLILAALAGEHVLLLGPPGTAKSALARALAEAFGGNHFEWLLSKFTTPEELFGPLSLSALKCDRYERISAGKLPEAHVSFLDEIFKSNSGVLNMLLPAINEGLFHNGQKPTKIPLRLLVGASNELPEGPELGALYDRFLLRYWTEYVQNEDSFQSLMLGGTREEAGPTFSVEDWDQMRAGVARVTVPKGVISQLFSLREALSNAGIQPSDRRLKRCLNLLRAAAWLAGETEVSEDHFEVLQHALWNEPDQIGKVKAEVSKITTGLVTEAIRLQDTILQVVATLQIQNAPEPMTSDYQQRLVDANKEAKRASDQIKALSQKALNNRQQLKIEAALKRIEMAMGPVRIVARKALGL